MAAQKGGSTTKVLLHLDDSPLHARPPLQLRRGRVHRLEVQRFRPLAGNHELLQLFSQKPKKNEIKKKHVLSTEMGAAWLGKRRQLSACGKNAAEKRSAHGGVQHDTIRHLKTYPKAAYVRIDPAYYPAFLGICDHGVDFGEMSQCENIIIIIVNETVRTSYR